MKKIVFLVFMCIVFFVSAQEKDSIATALELQIKKETVDSLKIPLQLQLAEYINESNIDSTRQILLNVQKLLENTQSKSRYYQQQRIKYYQILASCDEQQDQLTTSLENLQKSIDLANEIKDDKSLATSYQIRGTLSMKNNDSIEARNYYKKAIQLGKKYKDSTALFAAYSMYASSFYQSLKKNDSTLYYLKLAKNYVNSLQSKIEMDTNFATYYVADQNYEKALITYKRMIAPHKKLKRYLGLSSCFLNMGAVQAFLKEKEKSLAAMDSAIVYAKRAKSKDYLSLIYQSRRNINAHFKDYKAAMNDFYMHKIYYDSINDLAEAKRFTELELNYKFDKEKEIAAIKLENESTKKSLYFILIFVVLLLAAVLIYIINKRKGQKIAVAEKELALQQMEKIKADLILANRENELKKVVIENSITEEVLNKTLDDIKEIITFENEKERKMALKSLSASLLSEKTAKKSTASLQEYLEEVNMEFKILLDTKFPKLKQREKELLCMIKLGLGGTEISKLFNTSLASIKSLRYRIRKKLDIDPNEDMIAYIEGKNTTDSASS
ncbi:tetratricopeptide repeat protein [Kordia sp. SMS9]|uniref:helix-turn-helix transcriptional regulator n=1 Tax=Kordia sp. SMS9 TaxID=2282170 RepID=UPI000E106C8C|nr:hypothetical protein [Kordia sp. SMS9]AXG72226.1 tetratricopeptide repeat protein [Kordia sp. SMS9]